MQNAARNARSAADILNNRLPLKGLPDRGRRELYYGCDEAVALTGYGLHEPGLLGIVL
jgi:hypothetical protein